MDKEFLNNLFEYKDGNLYWKNHKYSKHNGKKAGGLKKDGYICLKINSKHYKAHRIVFLYHHGYLPKFIDHIDGNRSNNKIENLRAATPSENGYNSKLPKNNKSGIKNVCWHKQNKKWQVALRIDNSFKYFGLYDDLELAELVATEARDKYHKQFAKHN